MNNIEMNLNEMEAVTGGKGGSPTPLTPTAQYDVHRIKGGETLIRIANKYKIADYHKIIEWNPHIDPKTNMIRAGEYLWIKK